MAQPTQQSDQETDQENDQKEENMTVVGLLLVEGDNVSEESLRNVSLRSAKRTMIGSAFGFGVILHVHANSADDLNYALNAFAQAPNVTGVMTLALRSS